MAGNCVFKKHCKFTKYWVLANGTLVNTFNVIAHYLTPSFQLWHRSFCFAAPAPQLLHLQGCDLVFGWPEQALARMPAPLDQTWRRSQSWVTSWFGCSFRRKWPGQWLQDNGTQHRCERLLCIVSLYPAAFIGQTYPTLGIGRKRGEQPVHIGLGQWACGLNEEVGKKCSRVSHLIPVNLARVFTVEPGLDDNWPDVNTKIEDNDGQQAYLSATALGNAL